LPIGSRGDPVTSSVKRRKSSASSKGGESYSREKRPLMSDHESGERREKESDLPERLIPHLAGRQKRKGGRRKEGGTLFSATKKGVLRAIV